MEKTYKKVNCFGWLMYGDQIFPLLRHEPENTQLVPWLHESQQVWTVGEKVEFITERGKVRKIGYQISTLIVPVHSVLIQFTTHEIYLWDGEYTQVPDEDELDDADAYVTTINLNDDPDGDDYWFNTNVGTYPSFKAALEDTTPDRPL